jgi:hypothetical protein
MSTPKKWFFWPAKHSCTPLVHGKKSFSSTLNFTILQMVRNECKIWWICMHTSQLQDLTI